MSSDNGPIAGRDFHFQEVVAFSVRYYPFETAVTRWLDIVGESGFEPRTQVFVYGDGDETSPIFGIFFLSLIPNLF